MGIETYNMACLMQQIYTKFFFFLLFVSAAVCFPGMGLAESADVVGHAHPWQLNFQPAASPMMEKLASLHHFLLYVIFIVSAFVMALLVYVCVRFRRSRNPIPSKTTHNTLIEIIWTVVPIIILVAIAIPSLRIHYFMDKTDKPELTLKITGYQWYWGYEFPDQGGLSFESYIKQEKELGPNDLRLLSVDKPLVLPINTNIRVLLTAADVIHAWTIPAFGVKRDAMPGRLNETWFRIDKPGIYYGQCSELCGQGHGFMPIEVHAVEKEVFNAWVKQAKARNFAMDGLKLPAGTITTGEVQTPEIK